MTKEFLFSYINNCKLAVVSTVNHEGHPESAVIGIAVTKDLEIIFDTVKTSRKYENLLQRPDVAFVIGWNDESTVQYEGLATQLSSNENALKELYFEAFPDGKERAASWPGLIHFKVSPRWVRYSNFNEPQVIAEMNFDH